MKKFAILFFIPFYAQAQVADTLSKTDEQLLRFVGGAIKDQIARQMKENGTANGVKGLIKSSVKDVLSNTLKKTAGNLLNLGSGFGNGMALPDIINLNKEALLKKGKQAVIENFHQSLKNAANEALTNSIPMMVAQAIEFDVDSLVKYANSDSVSITSIFKNANKNALLNIVKPFAKTAFKISGGGKSLKKLNKALGKIAPGSPAIDPENLMSEKIVDSFLSEMQLQEALLKKNPASLLEGLLKLFNN
jgi:hypothetical protein